jgi:hypothetical protein
MGVAATAAKELLRLPAVAGKMGKATTSFVKTGAGVTKGHYESFAGSFLRGAAKPALKAAAFQAGANVLEEIANESDNPFMSGMASLGSFWAGTLAFRQALRAPIRGARAKWGYRRDALGGAARSLSRIYDKYMYAPEKFIGGMAKGFGGSALKSLRGIPSEPGGSRVPFLLRPVHGAFGIGRAVLGGIGDRMRYAGKVVRSGGKFQNVRRYGMPGVTSRLMGVQHPFLGAIGLGAAAGAVTTSMKREAGRVGDTQYYPAPSMGINPRNWAGGVTFMNARGGVTYRMGSDTMSARMSRGGRP